MAVASKRSGKMPKGENLLAAIVAKVQDLGVTHMPGILRFIEEAENKKEKVTFGVEIDMSESEPLVTVAIRYSQSVTDKRSVQLDDPDQGTFADYVARKNGGDGGDGDGEGKTSKKKGKEAEPAAA